MLPVKETVTRTVQSRGLVRRSPPYTVAARPQAADGDEWREDDLSYHAEPRTHAAHKGLMITPIALTCQGEHVTPNLTVVREPQHDHREADLREDGSRPRKHAAHAGPMNTPTVLEDE